LRQLPMCGCLLECAVIKIYIYIHDPDHVFFTQNPQFPTVSFEADVSEKKNHLFSKCESLDVVRIVLLSQR
uniref:Uncharacterized protein n=1 Tax=Scophthalmus maximus TaxID=52904 RepID=A0A8D3E9D4_SCOMX